MKILATSVRQLADDYLHAGYVSASPSAQIMDYPPLRDTADTGTATTMESAFALADTTTADSAITLLPGLFEGMGQAAPALALVAGITLLASMAYRHRRRPIARPLAQRPILAGAPMALQVLLVTGLFAACVQNPWANVELKDYDDPEAATALLQQTLIKEGLSYHHSDVGQAHNLAVIQDVVALPTDDPDEGVAYALASYGRDGWGNEFLLEGGDDSVYTVTSAGPDGELDTDDDMQAELDAATLDDYQRAYYLTRREGVLWLLIRSFENGSNELDSHSWGSGSGYLLDSAFYGIALTAEALEENENDFWYEVPEDWTVVVDEITTFYEGFATDSDPDPIVVQHYEA